MCGACQTGDWRPGGGSAGARKICNPINHTAKHTHPQLQRTSSSRCTRSASLCEGEGWCRHGDADHALGPLRHVTKHQRMHACTAELLAISARNAVRCACACELPGCRAAPASGSALLLRR